MKVLTGIDLPYAMTCGSMILSHDIYSPSEDMNLQSRFLCLEPIDLAELPTNWRACSLQKSLSFSSPIEYQSKLDEWVQTHVEQFEPDVIHCQHLCYGMSNALTKQSWGVPLVGLCHGTDVIEASRSERHKRDFEVIVEKVDRLIFPSQGILSDARRVLTIPEEKISIVPWGIPDELFSVDRPMPRYSRKPFNILYAGRFDESKGIDTLLLALATLPDFICLALIGTGPELEKLRLLALQLNLLERLTFHEWKSRPELQATFQKYQLLVLPSLQVEAFGLVCIEAQAAGLPVLASDASGLPETLPFSKDAFSFRAGDATNLAEKVSQFTENGEEWEAYSMLCKQNSSRFALSNCIKKLFAVTDNAVRQP